MSVSAVLVLCALAKSASAAAASTFTPPAASPTDTSSFYVGASNGTVQDSPAVTGAVFDRLVQIWLENTDFEQAASQEVFQNLSTQGITLTSYYGLTHTSEPNYIGSVGGDFWGLYDDDLEYIPNNISTIVDLLDQKNISWAEYQENMPTDGYGGFNYTNPDGYTYYVRKHNPLVIYNSVGLNTTRAARIRNFNDFAVDLGNNSIPQWVFVTPNLREFVDYSRPQETLFHSRWWHFSDGYDTDIAYAAQWLQYWLVPLLQDPDFNTDRTLILFTFDDRVRFGALFLLGGVVPENLKNTTDDTFYTHYSILSTVEANWGLGNLGRQDTNKTLANVFSLVANVTGYKNNGLTSNSQLPLLNLTQTIPGPLNPQYWIPYLAPNTSGTGGGSGPTFIPNGTNMILTTAPAPVNLTATATNGALSGFTQTGFLMSIASAVFTSALLL